MNKAEKIAELINAVINWEREQPDGVWMSVSNSLGTVVVQVSPEYFDDCYQGAGVEVKENSRDYDRHSWTTPSGCEVFCLKKSEWVRAA